MNTFGRSGNRTGKYRFNWAVVLRGGVTASILAYLASKLDWSELSRQMFQSDPFLMVSACLLLGTTFILCAARWRLLLKVQGITLSLRSVTVLTLIGQFFNSFLLGATGGDVVKVLYILKYAPDKKANAALSIIMDRVLGLFVLLCITLIVLPWQFRVLLKHGDTRLIAYGLFFLFASVLAAGTGLALIPFHLLPPFLRKLWEKIPLHTLVESLVSGFRQHGRSPGLTLKAVLLSIIIWFIVFAVGYCVALAIHLKATYMQILIILSVVTCVISFPISIGGHGIREGAFLLMFSAFGVISAYGRNGAGQEKAVLFSLLLFSLYLFWSLVGGLFYLTFNWSLKEMDTKIEPDCIKDPS